jgi:hypothetical protein
MNKIENLFTYFMVALFLVCIGLLIGISIPQKKSFEEGYEKGYEEGYEEGYHTGYNEAIIDYYDDIIDLLIENAVLEERIEWLEYLQEKQYIDIDLIINDVEDLLEITIRYYESEYVNIMTLEEYIQWKDPNLYQRILNEWK